MKERAHLFLRRLRGSHFAGYPLWQILSHAAHELTTRIKRALGELAAAKPHLDMGERPRRSRQDMQCCHKSQQLVWSSLSDSQGYGLSAPLCGGQNGGATVKGIQNTDRTNLRYQTIWAIL